MHSRPLSFLSGKGNRTVSYERVGADWQELIPANQCCHDDNQAMYCT